MIERRISLLFILILVQNSVKSSDIWNEPVENSKPTLQLDSSDSLITADVVPIETPKSEHSFNSLEGHSSFKTENSFNSLESAGFLEGCLNEAAVRESPFQSDSSEEAAAIEAAKKTKTDSGQKMMIFKSLQKPPLPNLLLMTPESETSNPELLGRPRASSFSRHSQERRDLHVYFYPTKSDQIPTDFPSFDIPDTPENRRALHAKLLKKAESGDFPYFSYLKSVQDNLNWRGPFVQENAHDIRMNELSAYNPDSLLFKALRGDNPDILVMIMAWKGISFDDLHASPRYFVESTAVSKTKSKDSAKSSGNNSFYPSYHHSHHRFSPSSYPPKGKSLLDSPSDGEEEDDEIKEFKDSNYRLSSDGEDSENDDDDGRTVDETVLGRAIEIDALRIFTFMLENGVRDYFPPRSQNCLHLAITTKRANMVSLLLQHRLCDIEQVDGALKTPLMLAIESDDVSIVAKIIDANASLIATDFEMRTPLHFAAIHGNINVLALLKDALHTRYDISVIKSLIFASDLHGNTPVNSARNGQVRNFILNEIGGSKS